MIDYTQDQVREIERLSGLNFNYNEIAIYLNVDVNQFIKDANGENELVYNALIKGKLMITAEKREAAKKSPRLLKQISEIERENEYRQRLNELYDFTQINPDKRRTNYYDRLISYGSKEIAHFKKTGQSDVIREMDQKYIEYISYAAQLFNRNQSVTYIANKFCELFTEVDFNMAKKYIYDAINYFHLNHSVQNKAWDTFFALEELPKLKELALKKGNIELATQITIQQHKILTAHPDQPFTEEDLQMKPQLISPDVSLKRLGITQKSLKEMWIEGEKMIDTFDIEPEQKERIRNELKREIDPNFDNR
jgi:hypothetical protein